MEYKKGKLTRSAFRNYFLKACILAILEIEPQPPKGGN
jgi:hypothetical protein